MPTGGGSSGSQLLNVRATLTDAQIKALPTTPIQIVTAPGAGKLIVPTMWMIQKSFVGAYTNVTVSAQTGLFCTYDGNDNGTHTAVAVTEAGYAFFGAVSLEQYPIPPGTHDDGNGGNFPPGGTDLRNLGLFVQAINADGPFTGGDAANLLTVDMLYYVLTL